MYKPNQALKQPKIYNPAYTQEKKKSPRWVLVLLFVLIILSALYYLFIYSEVFKVKNIIVENDASNLIANDLEKYKNTNILLLNTKKINRELSDNYPEIRDIKIMRGLPDTIKVQLVDQQPKLVWQSNNNKYLIDARGIAYAQASEHVGLPIITDNNNIVVEIGQTVVSESFENFISQLNAKYFETIGYSIINFQLNETIFQVDAVTHQGINIKFDTTRKVDDQLSDLKKFLAQNKDEIKSYIDVRVDGKVYYK